MHCAANRYTRIRIVAFRAVVMWIHLFVQSDKHVAYVVGSTCLCSALTIRAVVCGTNSLHMWWGPLVCAVHLEDRSGDDGSRFFVGEFVTEGVVHRGVLVCVVTQNTIHLCLHLVDGCCQVVEWIGCIAYSRRLIS